MLGLQGDVLFELSVLIPVCGIVSKVVSEFQVAEQLPAARWAGIQVVGILVQCWMISLPFTTLEHFSLGDALVSMMLIAKAGQPLFDFLERYIYRILKVDINNILSGEAGYCSAAYVMNLYRKSFQAGGKDGRHFCKD